MPLVDRVVAPLGARRLVQERPGSGWMLVEVVPVVLWSRITGSFDLANAFYLIQLIMLLGGDADDLSWLPLITCLATVCATLLVLRRRDRHGNHLDARHIALRDVTIGRVFWLGVSIWPWLAWQAELPAAWILGGMFCCLFCGNVFLFSSVSAWSTWTQDLVPRQHRGVFFAWRHIVGLLAYTLMAQTLEVWWPAEGAPDDERLVWYLGLFTALSLGNLISTLMLARVPAGPNAAAHRRQPVRPLREALRGQGPFRRFVAWNACNVIALTWAAVYLPVVITEAGIADDYYLKWDAWGRTPGMLAGMLAGGWLLGRLGAAQVLVGMNLLTVVAFGLALWLTPAVAWWLLPLVLIVEGLSRGLHMICWMARLIEVSPPGDPRFPSLCIGFGGLIAALAAPLQQPLLAWVGSWEAGPSGAWVLVATGTVLRLLSTPLLIDRRRHEPV